MIYKENLKLFYTSGYSSLFLKQLKFLVDLKDDAYFNIKEYWYLLIIGSGTTTPALLISTSTPPSSVFAHLITPRMSSSFLTSHSIGYTSVLTSYLIFAANSLNFYIRLATGITFIPLFASVIVICAPIPTLAPVTNATFPIQRSIVTKVLIDTVIEIDRCNPFCTITLT